MDTSQAPKVQQTTQAIDWTFLHADATLRLILTKSTTSQFREFAKNAVETTSPADRAVGVRVFANDGGEFVFLDDRLVIAVPHGDFHPSSFAKKVEAVRLLLATGTPVGSAVPEPVMSTRLDFRSATWNIPDLDLAITVGESWAPGEEAVTLVGFSVVSKMGELSSRRSARTTANASEAGKDVRKNRGYSGPETAPLETKITSPLELTGQSPKLSADRTKNAVKDLEQEKVNRMPVANSAVAETPKRSLGVETAFSGNWESPSGSTVLAVDDGTKLRLTLETKDPNLKSLDGELTRSGDKYKDRDVLRGVLRVAYKDDPLSESDVVNYRQLNVKRAFITDEGSLRLLSEKVFWDSKGRELRRESDTIDLRRAKSD